MEYIFLHGLGQTVSCWNSTVQEMNAGFDTRLDTQFDTHCENIRCPDLSGWLYNKTPCYSNLYQGLENYCQQFDSPLNICGLSLGGILAMHYCIDHPEKVKSLVLIGTQYVMPKRLLQIQNVIFHLMPDSAFQKAGFQKEDFIYLSKSMMNLNFRNDLRNIRCPVLVVCGAKDKANKAAALQLKELIPCVRLSMIEHAGHEVNLDAPVELGRELRGFYGL